MGDAAIDHLTLNGNRRGGEEGATDPIKKREGGTADEGLEHRMSAKKNIFLLLPFPLHSTFLL